ncbi:MAG: MotA/TolQ/ExbB proton channel family protein [Bryobacteraceae bacterium]
MEQIILLANKARRNGLVSLEAEVDSIEDSFMRKALSLGVDGTDLEDIRQIMEVEMDVEESRGRAEAKVYEAAGGYAPTIGIIGAVLGLIQVMKHLDNIELVGHGIAVAFVATVYGVALANLFLIPAGQKLKARVESESLMKELALEGICAVIQGLNPKVIEQKLEAYATDYQPRHGLSASRVSAKGKAA